MNRIRLKALLCVFTGVLLQGTLVAQLPARHWSGFATVHGEKIPVRLDLSGASSDGQVSGSFLNGAQVTSSSGGELTGTHLVLDFNYFARKLEGDFSGQVFTGTYSGTRGEPTPLELHADMAPAATIKASVAPGGKEIQGDWEIAVKSPKGESAWTLRVTPLGHGQVKAVILRIDGDTGGLYGSYDSDHAEYRVSHFNASGAALYTIKPQPDGTLLVTNPLRDGQQWTARRPLEARKENLAPPTKATEQTSVVDSSQPFHFSAPDLNGNIVSNNDPRFRGKVVIVAVGGSWCPNCHDEAPFLVELYNRYHARGLEIVDISFEEDDQLKNPQRLRAFEAKYHIPYIVLLGGTPAQVNQKLPQGKNLNCWPTTFFIGRDGLVKETHAGFSGPETGAAYTELKAETSTLLDKLLSQREIAQR
jgi:thiol-disulfide isomerase/thioredoxin